VTNLGDEYTEAEATTNRIFDRLESRIRSIIMSSAEQAASGVADQLGKAKGEIDGVIADLQDQAVSDATVERLQNLSQALDDVVPDQPEPEPEQPVAEPENE
jgi:hypothetical protein